MNFDNITIGEARQIACMFAAGAQPSETSIPVGENVLIRGVTLYYVGYVERVTEQEVVLSDASWVASTGRFNEALVNGTLDEVEPFPHGEVVVGRGAIMDVSRWPHALPKAAK